MSNLRIVNGSPCDKRVAAYFALLLRETKAHVNSIYRGQDAAMLLHRYGQHTQAEIHRMYPDISNPPGRSTHELRSDGVAYAGPIGRRIQWWGQGIDVNDSDVPHMIAAARRHGWSMWQPYRRGVEFHHLNFAQAPHPRNARDRFNLLWLRARLPRR